jgi:choline dehydrogenase-like flavoprotein
VKASILPDIPSGATNATTIMLTERIAAKPSAKASTLKLQRSEPEHKEI